MSTRWKYAGALLVSSVLQTVIFPVAAPLPLGRALLAWIALVPWFAVLLTAPVSTRRELTEVTAWSYLCGVLWYFGHCYWIYQTMHQYGGLSVPMAALALLLFCLYLGLYHAVFGWLVGLIRGRCSASSQLWPFLFGLVWVAVELARARVTSFPWDLLGYSQIDNAALTPLAPWTGVYGISFVITLVNGLFSSAALRRGKARLSFGMAGLAIALVFGATSFLVRAQHDPSTAIAVLVQPNLSAAPESRRQGQSVPLESEMIALTNSVRGSAQNTKPSIVLWPEAPTTYELNDPVFRQTMARYASESGTPLIVDANMIEPDRRVSRQYRLYNSAALFAPGIGLVHRYDKIHLVPFGEFTPYASLFSFASGLTQEVGTFDRGSDRSPLADGRHRYGTFICYESIFGDEVRQPVLAGADVLVNLSDDGWYGDTSAPFQHINMARMRAIENRRWLLRDTNNGITAAIDPHGNVREQAVRNVRTAVLFHFAYTTGLTFYTRYGDVFAYACTVLTLLALITAIVTRWRFAT